MKLALERAGFVGPSFKTLPGPAGTRFFVEAKKPVTRPYVASRSTESRSKPQPADELGKIRAARAMNIELNNCYLAGTA